MRFSKWFITPRFRSRYDAELVRQYRMMGLPVIARELMRLGFAS